MAYTKRKKHHRCPKMPKWMATFTDMTTLLLTFFILMFTTAEVDGHKLRLILSSFAGSLGVMRGGLTLEQGPLSNMGLTVESFPVMQTSRKVDEIRRLAYKKFRSLVKGGSMRLEHKKRGFVISIPGYVFFEPGSVKIKETGFKVLEELSDFFILLKRQHNLDKQIFIEGHSSREPEYDELKTKQWNRTSSIWEYNLNLSADRAENVSVFFIQRFLNFELNPFIKSKEGHKARIVMKAFGDFQPMESNNTPEERIWNRRIDILIKVD